MKKIIYTFIFILITNAFCFSQTKDQKNDIFNKITVFLNTNYLGSSQEDKKQLSILEFNKNAVIIPVKKLNYCSITFPEIDNIYYVIFKGEVFRYNNKSVSFLKASNFTQRLKKLYKEQKTIFIGYLFDNQITNKHLFINNEINNFIEDYYGIEYNNFKSFLIKRFGNIDKFKELNDFYTKQNLITIESINKAIQNNYHLYESTCSKNPTLVVDIFISQLKIAIGDLSLETEHILRNKILKKIDPMSYLYKIGKVSKSYYEKHHVSINSELIEKNKKIKHNSYNLTIFGIDVMDDLLSVLTKQEFIKYLNYIDLYQPISSKNNKSTRMIYGLDVLRREGLIDSNNHKAFSIYIQQIISNQGCN